MSWKRCSMPRCAGSPSAACSGHGGETEHVENYRGTTVKMALSEKVRLEIGVSNHFVQPTVDAIMAAARTGEQDQDAVTPVVGTRT